MAVVAHSIALWLLYEKTKQNHWKLSDWLLIGLVGSYGGLTYYLNIFSRFDISDLSRKADFVMKLNSFFFGVVIVVGLLTAPTKWPYFSAAVTFVMALNNFLLYDLASKEYKIEQAHSLTNQNSYGRGWSRDVERELFLDQFSKWWIGMALFVFSLIIVGVLLHAKILQDTWAYAAITALITISMIYLNGSREAQSLRMGLDREFRSIRRNRAYRQKVERSTASAAGKQ
jgi:hypothetical protein